MCSSLLSSFVIRVLKSESLDILRISATSESVVIDMLAVVCTYWKQLGGQSLPIIGNGHEDILLICIELSGGGKKQKTKLFIFVYIIQIQVDEQIN